jgi:hypothetical protein
LNFLKILSQYEASKKLSEPPFLRANTVLEAEKLCIEGEIRPYLRQFSSTNSEDHPLSRNQLLNLIDTFLNMLDINITHTIAKRKEAKQLIQAAAPNFDDGRCHLHGGKSTGSKTPEGKLIQKMASWKHGMRSKEAIKLLT